METYQPSTPRAAMGLIAAAMAAITVSALVVLPAHLNSAGADLAAAAPAPAKAGTRAPIEVAISPARIDIVVVRAPDVAWALTDTARPNCKPEG